MERDPHMMIEGMAIASYALNCHVAYIYIRGEYRYLIDIMDTALAEARAAGLLNHVVPPAELDWDGLRARISRLLGETNGEQRRGRDLRRGRAGRIQADSAIGTTHHSTRSTP